MATQTHDVVINYSTNTAPVEAAAGRVSDALENNAKTARKAAVAISTAEQQATAKIVGADAALKAKAKTLGLTLTQTKRVIAETKKLNKSTTAAVTQTKKFAASAAVAADSTQKMGRSVGLVAQQLPDVVSQLSAGANPMQVFIQQGGQVVQQMDMMALAGKGLAFALSPVGLGLGAAVAAVGVATVIAAKDLREAEAAMESSRATAERVAAAHMTFREAIADVNAELELLIGMTDAETVAQQKRDAAIQSAAEADRRAMAAITASAEAKVEAASNTFELVQAESELRAAQERRAAALDGINRKEAEALEQSAQIAEYKNEQAESEDYLREREKARAEGRKRAAEQERETASLTAEVQAAQEKAVQAQLDSIALVQHERDKEIARLEEIATLRPELARQASDAIIEIERATAEEITEIQAEQTAAAEKAAEQLADKRVAEEKRASDAAEREAEQRRAYAQDLTVGLLDGAAELADGLVQEGGKGAMAAHAISQTAAIAQIGIDTAAAVVKGIAMFGPPPSPLGIAATAAAVGIGGIQAGIVANTPPPSFHVGGIVGTSTAPDEVAARLLPGESVLNRGATARLGEAGVNALNGGAGMGRIEVVNRYKHRVFDRFVADNLKMQGSPLGDAVAGSGSIGHRKRT